ncbi:hypothetical protein L208DRAFT_1207481, partial [Tricholoma matsutake]
KYKPIAKKLKSVITSLPSKFCIEHNIIGNPLAAIPTLIQNPPPFTLIWHYTEEHMITLQMHHGDFLLPKE